MLKLVSYSQMDLGDIELLLADQKNRKKTPNMILASHLIKDLLEKTTALHPTLADLSFDIIFCTGEGELEQTVEFYRNLALYNRSRPTIFQNSLHNSTLGALSLEIKGIISGMTISNGDLSCELALDAALASATKNPVLIIGIDIYIDMMKPIRIAQYKNPVTLKSGASAGLFIPEEHIAFSHVNGPVIKDIQMRPMLNNFSFHDHYCANGLEKIHAHLQPGSIDEIFRPNGFSVKIIRHED